MGWPGLAWPIPGRQVQPKQATPGEASTGQARARLVGQARPGMLWLSLGHAHTPGVGTAREQAEHHIPGDVTYMDRQSGT